MVLVAVICHGDSSGNLKSVDGTGWQISDIVGTLNDVKTLARKPKVFFVNACRGGKIPKEKNANLIHFFCHKNGSPIKIFRIS